MRSSQNWLLVCSSQNFKRMASRAGGAAPSFSRASPCMWSARAQFAAIAFKLNLLKCYKFQYVRVSPSGGVQKPASGEREEAGLANSSHVEKTCAIPTAKYLFLDFNLLSTNTKHQQMTTSIMPTHQCNLLETMAKTNCSSYVEELHEVCDWTNKRGGGGEKN